MYLSCFLVNWGLEANAPDRTCVDECEPGTFGAPDDRECLPCHPSCRTCINSPNHCTACAEGYELDINTCVNSEGCRDDQFTNGKLLYGTIPLNKLAVADNARAYMPVDSLNMILG